MAAAEGQVHLVGTARDLLMGEGTKYDVQDDFNPFNRQQRPEGGPRPYAHGSWLGAEWQAEAVVPIRVIANGSNKDVPTTRAAIQEMTAAFSAVGASGEVAELRFWLDGDDQEFLMYGRPRGPEPDLSTIGLGYVYASAAFVAADPRVYSGTLTTVTTGMGVQRGGLILPARPATTRLRLPGTAGAYASTPSHASLNITGDLGLRWDGELSSWVSGASQSLISKFVTTGNQRAYRLRVDLDGKLRFQWSTTGADSLSSISSVVVPVTSGRLAVWVDLDVNNGASQRVVTFYTAPTIAGPWTQLGTNTPVAGVTSVYGLSSAALEVGSINAGTIELAGGVTYAAEVRSGATPVANPNFNAQAAGATSFTDSTGKLWTLNGDSRLVGDTYRGGVTLPTTIPGRLVGGSITITNSGTTAAPLLLRIDGPAVEPWIRVQRPDGTTQTVRFDLTLLDGQWLTVDSVTHQALLNDQPAANMRGLADWGMDEYPLLPGTSVIRFGGAEYDPDAELSVSARSAWL
jgi:hypothetical protein